MFSFELNGLCSRGAPSNLPLVGRYTNRRFDKIFRPVTIHQLLSWEQPQYTGSIVEIDCKSLNNNSLGLFHHEKSDKGRTKIFKHKTLKRSTYLVENAWKNYLDLKNMTIFRFWQILSSIEIGTMYLTQRPLFKNTLVLFSLFLMIELG